MCPPPKADPASCFSVWLRLVRVFDALQGGWFDIQWPDVWDVNRDVSLWLLWATPLGKKTRMLARTRPLRQWAVCRGLVPPNLSESKQ